MPDTPLLDEAEAKRQIDLLEPEYDVGPDIGIIVPEPVPELVGVAATHRQLNEFFNKDIANQQDLEVGSFPWQLGGAPLNYGQAGAHSSYGWDLKLRVNQAYARAVLANFCHRRGFYENAPVRNWGYTMGSRPRGWTPEIPGDLSSGEATYLTTQGLKTLSSFEAEHLKLAPLYALIDSPPVTVTALGAPFPSNLVAWVVATWVTRAAVGLIRATPTSVYNYTFGDRATFNLVDVFMESAKRRCLEPADVEHANEWIDNVLTYYGSAPGIGLKSKVPGGQPIPAGKVFVMTFNGLNWALPILHDAWKLQPEGHPRKTRIEAIVERWSQWIVDLEAAAPGKASDMVGFFAPADDTFWQRSEPVDSLAGLVTEADMVFDNLTWGPWAARAWAVARYHTNDQAVGTEWRRLKALHLATKPHWIVGEDRTKAVVV